MCNFDLREIIDENLNKNFDKKQVNKFDLFTLLYLILFHPILFLKCIWYKLVEDNEDESESSQLVMIEGPWGIGKTYIFNKQIKPIIEDIYKKNVIYTSLFGVKDKQEIKNKIIDRYINNKYRFIGRIFSIFCMIIPFLYLFFYWFYTKDLYKMKISVNFCDIHFFFFTYNILKNIVWFSVIYDLLLIFKICPLNYLIKMLDNKYLGTGFSLQNAELNHLFNNEKDVFVFDDLERISDNADIKEILGFLNELRDVYQFNVIVIVNEEELKKRKDNKSKYEYFREKFNPAKFEVEYREEILNHLIEREENEDVKYLIEKVVKPLCGEKNTKTTTSNLRVIKRFIEIIENIFEKIKKNKFEYINEINEYNINKILNLPCNQQIVVGIGNIYVDRIIETDSVANCLYTDFKNYIEKLYNIKNAYHQIEDNANKDIAVELADLSNINENYMKQNCVLNKLELMICLYFYYEKDIQSKELFILKLKEADKFIDNLEYCKYICAIFEQEKCLDNNKQWIKDKVYKILDNNSDYKHKIYKITEFLVNNRDYGENKARNCIVNNFSDYVYEYIELFIKNIDEKALGIFLFSDAYEIVGNHPDIISAIIKNNKHSIALDFIINDKNYIECKASIKTKKNKEIFDSCIKELYDVTSEDRKRYLDRIITNKTEED